MHQYFFEKLEVWQLSRKFTKEIYILTKQFPKSELFGLVNQMRREAISISSNIAEGISRKTYKDQARFTGISYGSAIEVLNQLIISKDLEYVSENDYSRIRKQIEEITIKLNNLYNTQIKEV
jgi:four helix bundle protein